MCACVARPRGKEWTWSLESRSRAGEHAPSMSRPATMLSAGGPPSARGRVPGRTGLRELGRGRSGIVFLGDDGDGRRLACKVFGAGGLTRIVQIVFLGAPNPYAWNEDALRCAYLRRRILARLVEHWFTGRVRVAEAVGLGWNEEHRAFELRAELSPGVALPLHHPGRRTGRRLLRE